MLRAQVIFTRVARLCVHITSDGVTDGARYPVGRTHLIAAGSTGFEVVSTERVSTQVTGTRMSWARYVATFCTARSVVCTDDIIADTAFPAVSLTD